VQGVACAQGARRVKNQLGSAMKVGGHHRKQSEVDSHHAFKERPRAQGLLRVDGSGALLDAKGAGKLRNAPGRGNEFTSSAGQDCYPISPPADP
jgi:hypothetical protein